MMNLTTMRNEIRGKSIVLLDTGEVIRLIDKRAILPFNDGPRNIHFDTDIQLLHYLYAKQTLGIYIIEVH